MSLPFLKPKKIASVIMTKVQPSGEQETKHDGDDLLSAAEDLISAINMKDAARVASALKAAFQIVDSEPHEEGEHLGE